MNKLAQRARSAMHEFADAFDEGFYPEYMEAE